MSIEAVIPTVERGRALLAEIGAALADLRELSYATLSADDLQELSRGSETVGRSLFAVQIAQTDEIDQRGMAAALSCPSTAVLLRQLLRIPVAEARLRVRAAQNTHPRDLPSGGESPAPLPVLAAALESGVIDRAHVATVLATLRTLPVTIDDALRIEAEQQLVSYAVDLDADQFRTVAAHLAEVLDPDGTPDVPDAASRAEFHIGVRHAATGLTPVHGRLDDLSIETLRTAIDALAAPRTTEDGGRDARPPATRRAHALVEVLHRAVTHVDLPTHGGHRPHITVTLHWDLVRQRLGTAVTGTGATLTPGDARRLLCDAQVIPAILGSAGEVLDLGRSTRTFNQATRRAITLRDRGCTFPGCDRPPGWTDVHHLHFWKRDLGATSYANGTLLCAYHHGEIHKEQWQARMSTDGHPEFIPPRWIDPDGRPRRNTLHHHAPDTG